MFRDTERELKRLEEELLEEEQPSPTDTDELLAQLHQEPGGENPIDDSQAYNADRVDVTPEELTLALEGPLQKERLTGLVVSALLLTAGILGLLAWWLVRLLG